MNIHALTAVQLEFFQLIEQSWQQQQLDRLILSQYRGDIQALEKIIICPVMLKNQMQLKVVYRYKTQDITKNYDWDEFEKKLVQWLTQCLQSNLFTHQQEIQLKYKKQQWQIVKSKSKVMATQTTAISQNHDRDKKRWITQQRPFLHLLGITDSQHNIIPSMARKWKQINKFVEIFANAIDKIETGQDLYIVDFGSGKGYLTCAIYDYLLMQHKSPHVTGVELRQELVTFCQNVAKQSDYRQLDFFQGDVRSYQPEKTDVMIALHACDIATDFAIHTGIRLDAKVIMCAPCCHKELRPQLQPATVLQPMLQFGVHAGQQAEMLTDTLRALLLQAYGYETKILEFVALEHTSKNKMILAIKTKTMVQPDEKILQQIEELKQFYGIRQQTLQLLLKDLPVNQDSGCVC